MVQTVKTMVEGGKATTGPPLGPALGPLGLNLGQIIKDINEKTKDFLGMQVPVTVTVTDPVSKSYEITIGIPPTVALLKKELKIEKGASKRNEKTVADATLDQIKKVAKQKSSMMLSETLESSVLEVLGTCVSMGITVEGKDPREMQRLIKSGSIKVS